eukprot:Platyproteum_vivax@DN3324_c0_g1_i1.p1
MRLVFCVLLFGLAVVGQCVRMKSRPTDHVLQSSENVEAGPSFADQMLYLYTGNSNKVPSKPSDDRSIWAGKSRVGFSNSGKLFSGKSKSQRKNSKDKKNLQLTSYRNGGGVYKVNNDEKEALLDNSRL